MPDRLLGFANSLSGEPAFEARAFFAGVSALRCQTTVPATTRPANFSVLNRSPTLGTQREQVVRFLAWLNPFGFLTAMPAVSSHHEFLKANHTEILLFSLSHDLCRKRLSPSNPLKKTLWPITSHFYL